MATSMPLNLRSQTDHAVNVILSLEKMKNQNFLCDFTIKVEEYSFKAHRTVLAACSNYFHAMFSSEMREVHEGIVVMKDVDAEAVKKCIDYMYVGEVDISMEEVENVLYVSKLIQLDGLSEKCFDFLQEHLCADNCLSSMSLSQMYGRDDVSVVIEEYIRKNLETVMSSEMFMFISTTSLMRYVETSTCGYWVSWKAIATWLSHNGAKLNGTAELENIMKFINPDVFPFEFLLSTVLNDLFLQNCEHGVEVLLRNIFFNTPALRKNLSMENCFLLQSLNATRLNTLTGLLADEVISEFMAKNIEKIVIKNDFLTMPERTVRNMLKCVYSKNATQEVIWNAMTKWVAFSVDRKTYFSTLFSVMELQNFTYTFLKQTVLTEPLVNKSRDCLQHVLRSIYARAVSGDSVSYIALLQQDSHEIKTFELSCKTWETHHVLPEGDFRRIVSVNKQLYVLAEGQFLHYQDDKWIRSSSMKQRKPSPWAQITAFQNAISVVEGNRMSHYDPLSNSWEEDLPGCSIVMGFCITSDGKYIYAFGGTSAKRYEPNHRKWEAIAPLRVERYDASAASLRNKVYVMGGNVFGKILKSVECYSTLNNTWEFVRNLLLPRSHFSAFSINGVVYAVGGARNIRDDGNQSDSIEVYHDSAKEWEILTTMTETESRVLACHYSPDEAEVIAEITKSIGYVT